MEYYTDADYVIPSPLTSPRLQAVKPDLGLDQILQWTDWRDTGRFEELDSDLEVDIVSLHAVVQFLHTIQITNESCISQEVPFHPALRDKPYTLGRPADNDDDEQKRPDRNAENKMGF